MNTLPQVSTLTSDERLALMLTGWVNILQIADLGKLSMAPLMDTMVERALVDTPWEWLLNKAQVLEALGQRRCIDFGEGKVPFHLHHHDHIRKPLWNAQGLAQGVAPHPVETDLPAAHLWQRYYQGRHWSVDVAVHEGRILWEVWAEGIPRPRHLGQYIAWLLRQYQDVPHDVRLAARTWLEHLMTNRLQGYSGVLNLETIGTAPIELHVRPSHEFGPLYGPGLCLSLYRTALGEKVDAPSPALGGLHLVVPREGERVILQAEDLDDDSWRDQIIYVIDEGP